VPSTSTCCQRHSGWLSKLIVPSGRSRPSDHTWFHRTRSSRLVTRQLLPRTPAAWANLAVVSMLGGRTAPTQTFGRGGCHQPTDVDDGAQLSWLSPAWRAGGRIRGYPFRVISQVTLSPCCWVQKMRHLPSSGWGALAPRRPPIEASPSETWMPVISLSPSL